MARDLIGITKTYWDVSYAVNSPDEAANMSVGTALRRLNEQDFLRPTDWRLKALMHDIQYDLIEGNTLWREERQVVGSVLTLPTRD